MPPTAPDSLESQPRDFDVESRDRNSESSISETVIEYLPGKLERTQRGYRLIPKHGPGSVATGERDECKWTWSHFYPTLNAKFPYYQYMYGVYSSGEPHHMATLYKEYRQLVRCKYPTARVVLVPKDARGPRIISEEPLEIQYIQQGLKDAIVHELERESVTTRGHINFTSQDVNRRLAQVASLRRSHATLDLEAASDRVSVQLVQAIIPKELWPYLDATRSTHTLMPSGETIELAKFAPMGSALCFPIESVIFASLVYAALRLSGTDERLAMRSLYVYGDDIIVPIRHTEIVMQVLESVGLVVNRTKTCWTGWFRESCGMDAYKGNCVTPIRIKSIPPSCIRDGAAAAAWCSYASQLWEAGACHAALYVESCVREVFGFIPRSPHEQGFLHTTIQPYTEIDEYPDVRWNADLQLPEAKLWTLRDKRRRLHLEPNKRLLRNLTCGAGEHPSSVVVRGATQTRIRRCVIQPHRWCPRR